MSSDTDKPNKQPEQPLSSKSEEELRKMFSPQIQGRQITLTEEMYHVLKDCVMEIHENYKIAKSDKEAMSKTSYFHEQVNQEQYNIEYQDIRDKYAIIKELLGKIEKHTVPILVNAEEFLEEYGEE